MFPFIFGYGNLRKKKVPFVQLLRKLLPRMHWIKLSLYLLILLFFFKQTKVARTQFVSNINCTKLRLSERSTRGSLSPTGQRNAPDCAIENWNFLLKLEVIFIGESDYNCNLTLPWVNWGQAAFSMPWIMALWLHWNKVNCSLFLLAGMSGLLLGTIE